METSEEPSRKSNFLRTFLRWIATVFQILGRAVIAIGRVFVPKAKLNKVADLEQNIAKSLKASLEIKLRSPKESCNVDESEETTSHIFPDATEESEEKSSSFFQLPSEIRKSTYAYLRPEDISILRLTNKLMNEEISRLRGIHLPVNDSSGSDNLGFELMINTGVESMCVNNFTEENPSQKKLFKYPELLRTLIIQGPIADCNFERILRTCKSLDDFRIHFNQFNILPNAAVFITTRSLILQSFALRTLKAFTFTSNFVNSADSEALLENAKSILENLGCPLLSTFIFKIRLTDSQKLVEFHLAVLNFIRYHFKSLKNVEVKIKQLLVQPPESTIIIPLDFENEPLQLVNCILDVDSFGEMWKSLLKSQTSLASLNLNTRGINWSELSGIIANCQEKLTCLELSNLLLYRDGRAAGLDLGELEDCSSLMTLSLKHQEFPQHYIPRVNQSSHLPQSLQEIELFNFVLKPHQQLAILLKLPNLKKLSLGFWTESEAALAAFIHTLAFLLKLEMTAVETILLTDQRRKMENRAVEIHRMTDALIEKAFVLRESFEREVRLTITKYPFHVRHSAWPRSSEEM